MDITQDSVNVTDVVVNVTFAELLGKVIKSNEKLLLYYYVLTKLQGGGIGRPLDPLVNVVYMAFSL